MPITNDHVESLDNISQCLDSALMTVNKARDATLRDFPKMENSFADVCDSVQKLAIQLADVNKSFCTTGQQLQSRTGALNDAVQSLTTDIDSLRVLMRNIWDEDFATGDYYDVLKSLGIRLFHELSKDHNLYGKDMKEFRGKYESFLALVARLDPKATPHQPPWGSIFDGVLKDLKLRRDTEKAANSRDTAVAREIIATLDEIPDPPCAGTSKTKTTTRKPVKKSKGGSHASSSHTRGQ